MKNLILAVFLILLMSGLISADEIIIISPLDGESCVTYKDDGLAYIPSATTIDYTTCYVFTNNSGTWRVDGTDVSPTTNSINYFNITLEPNHILWRINCANDTTTVYSSNNTFTLVNAPYCAVLDSTTCNPDVNLGGYGVVKTRLSNTRGFYLDNQDCNVFITDQYDNIVKAYNTMLYMGQTNQQVDNEGNWVNVADKKVPLTDSNGWYVFEFPITDYWAWYGESYDIHVICNGVETSCNFNVTMSRLPDTDYYRAMGKDAGGFIVVLVFFVAVVVYAWRRLRR